MYQFLIVLSDGSIKHVVALSLKDAVLQIEETDEVKVINVFRESSEPITRVQDFATVNTVVEDAYAAEDGCKAEPSAPVLKAPGSSLVLKAEETDGWLFDSWQFGEETISTDKETVVTVPNLDEVTYFAKFTAELPSISASEEAVDAGCTFNASYTLGEGFIKVEAVPSENAEFICWRKLGASGQVISSDATYNIAVPVSEELKVLFAEFRITEPTT